MSAIKMRDLNDTPHFEIRKIFAYDNIYLYYYDVDDNPHIVNAKAEESYRRNYYEIDTSTNGLFDDVKTRRSNSRYSKHGDEFLDGRRTTKPNDGLANRKIRAEDSDNGTGHTENDGDVDLRGEDNRKSRNTRLNHDENFDDVNDAFEQAIKVLQNIKGIDVSSEVVEEVGKAQKNIDKELDGYHAQKMRNKNSVGEIARKLKSEYNSNLSTQKLTSMLVDLYDYMANSDSADMAYINSQAKYHINKIL